ncbi:MFS transporter permease [Corynebacterium phocae]|uniref:MFS transporter permease n=1 Tax=Corynebacterium phocae TaxID=161895 RepID=A0A1L7D1D8_9CORY|nr:MDR family MFS transporter [Corynebacterium phocae]APT91897.1 MFS transporter permease [Corynebacterium phocae]KAA8727398.1 multidrug efflux MFS transporter [Corynebacterium phocae]
MHKNGEEKLSRDTVMTLAILVVAAMFMILNETSLAVGLTPIMGDLGVDATVVQWLITGFMLTMAVVIPTTGYLLERLSTRHMFFTSVGLFLAGTVVSALAPVFPLLLAGRVIQAAGTALMVPLLMTVTMTLVPPHRRGAVMGIISVVISVAPALGPTVGGVIIDLSSWHYIFWAMVPPMALVGIFGAIKLPNAGENRTLPLDIFSVALSPVAFGGVVYGLASVEDILAGSVLKLGILGIGVVALAVFIRRQFALARRERALLDLRVFKIRNFTFAATSTLLAFGVIIASFTVLPIYLQTSAGASAKLTGLVVLPGGIVQAVLAPLVGRAYDAYGPRPLVLPGAGMLTGSLALLALLTADTPVWAVIGMHCMLSAGMGLLTTPLMTAALSSLPGALYGQGSAIITTLQQLSAAATTAFLVVFLQRGTASGLAAGQTTADATATGISWAFTFAVGVGLVCWALAAMVRRVPVD